MSLAVRTRCGSAQPAPACTPSGGAAPPPPPPLPLFRTQPPALPFACSTAAAIPLCSGGCPVRGRGLIERGGQRQRVPLLLSPRDRGREDRHTLPLAAPPLLRSVAQPSPTPAGVIVLAPRAGTTYLLLHHSSPLLLHRLRCPPPARCTPPPVTPARRSAAPLFLPLMPPPERPPTPTRPAPTPPACCPTTAPRSSCTSCSDHSPLTRRRCAA